MYYLCSKVVIGGMTFEGVNEIKIKRSIYELGAKATVKVPVTAVLKTQNDSTFVEVAQQVEVGDQVEIWLGYDGVLKLEFKGEVTGKNLKAPLEIECEDLMAKMKNNRVTMDGNLTLEEILELCGFSNCVADELTINNFPIDDQTVASVMGKLKKDYGLVIYSDLDDILYAHAPYNVSGDRETVNYRLRWNVIKDDNLKFHQKKDKKVIVEAICIKPDGTELKATAGEDGGAKKTVYFYDLEDEHDLQERAENEVLRYSYDGYSGKIETFLEPYAQPGMAANIEDEVYPERNGKFFIESVEVKYGRSGARRTVEIGMKV